MSVHNFENYLKAKNAILEEEGCYGANPEEEVMDAPELEAEFELEGEEGEEEVEEVTLEDLKAMLDDISSRVSALEGGEEGMEEEGAEEEAEGEESEEEAEEEEA